MQYLAYLTAKWKTTRKTAFGRPRPCLNRPRRCAGDAGLAWEGVVAPALCHGATAEVRFKTMSFSWRRNDAVQPGFFMFHYFGSSPGPLLSPAPTSTTNRDDFGSCPTYPTSGASWAFPGDGGQEIKFRAMLYICEDGGSLGPNLPRGRRRELVFSFISSFIAHERTNEGTPSQKGVFPAHPSNNTVADQ